QQALLACGELRDMSPAHAAAGFVELGEVRRMVGDLDGAEAAFAEAEALCGRPQAGLALVRLAQGRRDAATAIIVRALDGETWNRLARARLLPPGVQMAIACDDLDAATTAAAELDAIATDLESPALLAAAATANGRASLARGDTADACVILRDALDRW